MREEARRGGEAAKDGGAAASEGEFLFSSSLGLLLARGGREQVGGGGHRRRGEARGCTGLFKAGERAIGLCGGASAKAVMVAEECTRAWRGRREGMGMGRGTVTRARDDEC